MPSTIPTFGEKQAGIDYVIRRGVYVVVLDGERGVAAIRDGETYFLPGGGCEPGETEQVTLAREVREECGVEIDIGECLGEAIDYLYSASEETYFEKHGGFMWDAFRVRRLCWIWVGFRLLILRGSSGRKGMLGRLRLRLK